MRRRLRSPRQQRERGAVAVETALVSLLLVTILYGIVETSFLFRDGLVVSSASRAGARMAASLPRNTTFAGMAKDQVKDAMSGMNMAKVTDVWIYRANLTTGMPPSGGFTTCSGNCIRYVWNGTDLAVASSNTGSWTASQQNACQGSQDAVGVYVKYSYPSRVGLFNGKTISEQTVMRLEPYIGGSTCS